MATNIKRHTQYYTGNGVPKSGDAFSSLNLYAHYFDRTAKKYYIYMGGGNWIIDPEYQITGGAAPTITVGTTTTLPPGSSATVTDIDPSGNVTLNFGIPKGEDGTGGGLGVSAYITVVPNGTDDTANLQAAINQSYTTGKAIVLYGTYYVSGPLTYAKDHEIVIIGNRCKIRTKNTNAYTVLGSVPMASMGDADIAVHRMIHIDGVTIYGSPTQKGIEPGPGYGCTFTNLKFYGLGHAIYLRFSLHAKVTNCQAINCTDGFTAGYGNWSGATISNSQSNHTQIEGCRIYMP